MKKFSLIILIGGGFTITKEVYADRFNTQMNAKGDTSNGYYSFFEGTILVCCYPIDKTIIESINEIV
jgi:hypothetical protein